MVRTGVAVAVLVAGLVPLCFAQQYPPGFVWNHNADFAPGIEPGWSTGNPSPDAMGNPVWEAVWVTGDPLGGPNPWYLGAGTRLVWDPFWFGTPNPNWVVANDTAPSVGRGAFLTPGAPSSPRVAALRWIAPATIPGGLLIDGYYVGDWTNNNATYQVAIARSPGGSASGAQLLFSDTLSSIWSQREQPVHLRVPVVNAGDVITFSTRALADHGWWTVWYHNIRFKVAKQPVYPIGFTWNRQADWVVRPEYDANTSYGNPGLDGQDQPVWQYAYTSGGGLGGSNPWFANEPTLLRWDPSWFGQASNSSWVSSDDNAPSIGPTTTYNLNHLSASRTGVIRWLAPATLPGGLRVHGSWSVNWFNNAQPYEAVIARLPQGRADLAEVITSRTFTIGEQQIEIPVDVVVPVVNQGDVIVVSGRPTSDHPWYIYFSDSLTFTHNCPSFVFSPPAESLVSVIEGEAAAIETAGQLVPDLAPFAASLRWHRDGTPIMDGVTPDGSVISGAATTQLSIANAKPSDSGRYELVASNSCGQTTSQPATLAVYPRQSFQWKRSTDWTTPSPAAAGTSVGNPDDDQLGVPVWHARYAIGGRASSVNPWYLESSTPMVWDPSWYGSSGAWAVGNDVNPPIGQSGMTDNRVDSAGRIPVVQWEAPVDLPEPLYVTGEISVGWAGGGDQASNRAPMEVIIAHTRDGVQRSRYFMMNFRQNCSSWSCLPWTTVVPVRVAFGDVQKGDRIVVSGRTLTASEGYPQHGWTTLGDDLVFSYSCRPIEIETPEYDYTIGSNAYFAAHVRHLSDPPSFTWLRNGEPIDISDPRYLVSQGATESYLLFTPTMEADVGTYSCRVESDCDATTIVAGTVDYCLGDHNRDSVVDGDDVIEFFADWDTNAIEADVDGWTGVDGDDVIFFFFRWDNGC